MLSAIDLLVVYLVVFGVGVTVLWLLIDLLQTAATRLDSSAVRMAKRISIGLLAWPLIAIAYALIIGLDFDTVAPMLAVPLTIGIVLMFTPAVSRILAEIPLHRLVALGTYRLAGVIFLYVYYAADALSRGFAMNAGWGDVLTGVLAIPVAWMVWKRIPGAGLAIIAWSVIGIGDLILAPISAFIYGAGELNTFPLSLIPLYLGPPFGILLHLVTMRAAWLQRARRSDATVRQSTL